jgi:hypothetical protein
LERKASDMVFVNFFIDCVGVLIDDVGGTKLRINSRIDGQYIEIRVYVIKHNENRNTEHFEA